MRRVTRRALLVAGLVLAAPAAAGAAPAPADGVRFAVKGDWGYGGADQAAVTRQMCREQARSPFAFVLTTGDNFYRPDGVATAENFTRPEACLLRSGVRWRAAWGNHDLGGDATATALGSPRRWFQFARGPLRVVAFHQPAYTAGFHAPGEVQQRRWVPLFRRHGVALVLQGHNHAYERMVVGGVTYITTGGGGAPIYPCVRPTPGLRRCLALHHFLTVRADPAGLDVRVIGRDGTQLERVRVPAR